MGKEISPSIGEGLTDSGSGGAAGSDSVEILIGVGWCKVLGPARVLSNREGASGTEGSEVLRGDVGPEGLKTGVFEVLVLTFQVLDVAAGVEGLGGEEEGVTTLTVFRRARLGLVEVVEGGLSDRVDFPAREGAREVGADVDRAPPISRLLKGYGERPARVEHSSQLVHLCNRARAETGEGPV
jgi:hypothetical protein